MFGEDLIRELCEKTDLPKDKVFNEIQILLAKNKVNPKTVTLDDFRAILVKKVDTLLAPTKH